jgi:serine/threonine-protein phosphatase 2A activator
LRYRISERLLIQDRSYLKLIRKLILTYNLEPAGSHGVWGLDDHSFLPYIFGSAQLSPPINTTADIATEGSLDGAPNPADVTKLATVERERKTNMYFSAIGFIYDVKKGPFWEHSPILFDISGVKAGWAKINKGMLKMYNAEVLSKFPVVQHFPFGSLFAWEKDPDAPDVKSTVHTSSQPSRTGVGMQYRSTAVMNASIARQDNTRAPWATSVSAASATMPQTAAPWASDAGKAVPSGGDLGTTRAPWASTSKLSQPGFPPSSGR